MHGEPAIGFFLVALPRRAQGVHPHRQGDVGGRAHAALRLRHQERRFILGHGLTATGHNLWGVTPEVVESVWLPLPPFQTTEGGGGRGAEGPEAARTSTPRRALRPASLCFAMETVSRSVAAVRGPGPAVGVPFESTTGGGRPGGGAF